MRAKNRRLWLPVGVMLALATLLGLFASLFLRAPMTTTTTPPAAALAPATNPDSPEQRAHEHAEHLARERAVAQQALDSGTSAVTHRQVRQANAQAFKQRLELIAQAVEKQHGGIPGAAAAQPVGYLDKDEIQASIKDIHPEVVKCYNQALRKNPGLAGTIKVLFEIAEDPEHPGEGAVVAGEVDEGVDSPFFEACVLQSIVGAKFKKPEGGADRKNRATFQGKASQHPL